MASSFLKGAGIALTKQVAPDLLQKAGSETAEKIVKGGVGAGTDLLPAVTRRGELKKSLKETYYPQRGAGTDKPARRAIDAGINTGQIAPEDAERLVNNVSNESEAELADMIDGVFTTQRQKGMNDQLTEMLEDYKPAETGVEYETGHRKASMQREVPEISTDLVEAKGNPEAMDKVLDSPGYRQLNDRNRHIYKEEVKNSPEQIDALITRQEMQIEGAGRLKEQIDEYARLQTLPTNDPIFGTRGKAKALKRVMKNIKTIARDNNMDLASLNLRTQDQQVFGMNRQKLRVEALLNDQLKAFAEPGQEWHHTFFGNKEGGSIFLQKLSQEPMVALNLMEHLRLLDLPTSGTIGNLTVMQKADHTKLHNLFRELGLEQSGPLDFADYMKAIGDAYLDGTADVNAIFRMIEIYAEEVAPFLKASEGVGTPMRATGIAAEAGGKYGSIGDVTTRGRTRGKQAIQQPTPQPDETMVQGPRKGKMESSPKAKTIATGIPGVKYTGSGKDPAVNELLKKLKKDGAGSLDSSGFGDRWKV